VLDKLFFLLKNGKYPTRANRYVFSRVYSDLVMSEVDLLYVQKANANGYIFMHLPKCGGTSVKTALSVDLNGHPFLADMLSCGLNKDMEVFTVCRNPYARLVSSYEYLKKWGEYNRTFKSLVLDQFSDFESFVFGWLNDETINRWIHFVPQVEFLKVAGVVRLDFFIQLEEVDNKWIDVRNRYSNVKDLGRENSNSNSNSNSSWAAYYNDDLRKKVYSLYKADFEFFGYKADI